ncbi:hypothetical protein Lepto7376_3584 [[Leptolyngbya] sp. PCC 7376]|uniref:hypothetical protein n=1 Tax=[Leptolyngbya] sp. PCC 7376 TaxID=111781 RepID=UPI00029F30F5|nr:hypothetical protein [[Leptolyngbya] sp. PCC 7376]AFY39773.1 hypothetical protein Lepto7376_3584 [[Leptolyngbya] sp. PCC 7376]
MALSIQRLGQLKGLGLAALALSCCTAIALLQQSRLESIQGSGTLTPEIVARQAETEKTNIEIWRKAPAFGFDNLLGDWAFLRFLQYFGDTEAREMGDYRMSADFFDVIVEQDPWFIESYFYLSGSSSLFAGTPERTVEILEKGLAEMTPLEPEGSPFLWRMKAIDEHLFLGDIDNAIKSYLSAAEWAGYHDDPMSRDAALRSKDTAAFLVRDPRSVRAQVTAWVTLLSSARDNVTRQRALSELEALGVELTLNENGTVSYRIPEEVWQAEREALNIQE